MRKRNPDGKLVPSGSGDEVEEDRKRYKENYVEKSVVRQPVDGQTDDTKPRQKQSDEQQDGGNARNTIIPSPSVSVELEHAWCRSRRSGPRWLLR